MRELIAHEQSEQARVRTFGQVRPEIAADYQGHKFVAVGSKLYYDKKWKFFADFLVDHVPHLFGREWFESEVAKPPNERHPVMQWRVNGINYMKKHQKTPAGGVNRVQPNGSLAAYLTFAYDLYIVEHNARLDERLLRRLKHPEQFQGARHELFAEATCLRAGFIIEHEDETDPTQRHAEFTATHKSTGQKISVEAKSRHRPGVLGQPGAPQAADELNLRFGKLLHDAVAKNPSHPLVVFLDTNLRSKLLIGCSRSSRRRLRFLPNRFWRCLIVSRRSIRGEILSTWPSLRITRITMPRKTKWITKSISFLCSQQFQ
jgi:hypothetical protein